MIQFSSLPVGFMLSIHQKIVSFLAAISSLSLTYPYNSSECRVAHLTLKLNMFMLPFFLSVYHMEVAQETEQRFLFPAFEKLHWYAADVILGKLTSRRGCGDCYSIVTSRTYHSLIISDYLYAGQEPPPYLLKAASALINPLQQWLDTRKNVICISCKECNRSFLYSS